jgi:transposase
VTEYGYKNAGFILDRGYFSKDNIRYMESEGYPFIIMVKGCKELVSSLVLHHRNPFETTREHSIRSYRVYGKTVKSKLYEDDTQERFFHIYFNPSRQAAEREQLEVRLDKFKLYMDKHFGEEITLGKTYHHYFRLTYDKKGHLLSYKEQEDVIQRELQLCGYFCIITSEDMTASQALIHYKGRDISEKLFSADKSFIGSKSMRICTNEAMATKLFIEFIALIIRNRIYNLLKETMLSLEQRPNYMIVPAAIRELEKIELIRRNGGSYRLDHAVSKRQKVILSSFGINADDISTISIEIDKLLKDSQSLMDSDEENGEEEI